MLDWFPTVALLGVMTTAALTDLKSRRIPNRLVVAGLVLGLTARLLSGWAALADGVLGAVLALLLGMLLFSAGAMGAGDGKLMAVIGAFLGVEQGLLALGAGAVVGAILSMLLALRSGVMIPVLLRTRDLGLWLVTFGRKGERARLGQAGTVSFPFGVALAIGAMAVWFNVVHW